MRCSQCGLETSALRVSLFSRLCPECSIMRRREKARRSAEKRDGPITDYQPCRKCNIRPGRLYTFYFGRRISASTARHSSDAEADYYLTRVQYRIHGHETLALCGSCVLKHWLLTIMVKTLKTLLLAGAAVFLVFGDMGDRYRVGLIRVILFLAGVFAAWLAVTWGRENVVSECRKDDQDRGDSLAIGIRRKVLKSRGHDSFFTSYEHSLLL